MACEEWFLIKRKHTTKRTVYIDLSISHGEAVEMQRVGVEELCEMMRIGAAIETYRTNCKEA